MKYLIIEDEPLAQEELVRMLKLIDSDFTLLASIDSVKESIKWLNENQQPDIIFMDIHLSDNICFEIFNNVRVTAPVIFTTAYDQYAIEAFKTNGIAYLLNYSMSFRPGYQHTITITLNTSPDQEKIEISIDGEVGGWEG